MLNWFLDVLRGMVIGLANVIPGVSGGTMMVSMGIYDKLIWSINHLFKEFKKCVTTLLPYAVGLVAAILLGAVGLKVAFREFPLPTNALFIGFIDDDRAPYAVSIVLENAGGGGAVAAPLAHDIFAYLTEAQQKAE